MSKLQKHIDLLTTECNKIQDQLEKDDYTVNELINANKRIGDIMAMMQFLKSLQGVLEQQRSRIIPISKSN